MGSAISVLEDSSGNGVPPLSPLESAEEAGAVTSLDHVVIRSPNAERAVALYAGRLGLSLRLDRTEPKWGARLLFFRCGDLIIEIAHDLKAGSETGRIDCGACLGACPISPRLTPDCKQPASTFPKSAPAAVRTRASSRRGAIPQVCRR
jgi:catechol 2,3-dioxygenase-like lactoylglutathione lyase family enzyme